MKTKKHLSDSIEAKLHIQYLRHTQKIKIINRTIFTKIKLI